MTKKNVKTGLGTDEVLSHGRHKYFNPNPITVKASDCAVRALSAFLWIPWEDAYQMLAEAGLKVGDVMSSTPAMTEVMNSIGAAHMKPYLIKGGRPTVKQMAEENPEGTFLIIVHHHFVTIKDGYYYDTWDSGTYKMKGYFKKVD